MSGDVPVRRVGIITALIVSLGVGFAAAPASARTPAKAHCSKATKKSHHGKCPASTPTTTTAAGGHFDSCSVVTEAEASSAIGTSVTAGVLGNATVEGGLACVFYGPSAPTPATPNVAQPDSVRVVVVKGSDAVTWYNDYKSKVPAQPISGYGDQAFYDGAASLSVLKGDSYLRIAVSPAGAAPSLSAEKQLASAVLAKL